MDALALYISVQSSSQRETPPTSPQKSSYQDHVHQIFMVDARLPPTSCVSVVKQLQDIHPATNNHRESSLQTIKEIKVLSTKIMIPEARNPPEQQIFEDPNVAGVIAGLIVPFFFFF